MSNDPLEATDRLRYAVSRQFGVASGPSLLEVVERSMGINAQTVRAIHIGLHARFQGFDAAVLDELLGSYDLVKANLFRGTVHLVTRRQYQTWRHVLQPMLIKIVNSFFPRIWERLDPADFVERAPSLIRAADPNLEGLSRAELGEVLRRTYSEPSLAELGFAARMVLNVVQRAPSSSSWSSVNVKYILADDIFGVPENETREGLYDIAGSFRGAFGPSTVSDLRYFTGLTGLNSKLSEVGKGKLLSGDTGSDAQERELSSESPNTQVQIVPEYDSVFFSSNSEHTKGIRKTLMSGPGSQMLGALILDGTVVGRWRHTKKEGPVLIQLDSDVERAGARAFDEFRDWYLEQR